MLSFQTSLPAGRSQRRTVLSWPPDNAQRPSPLRAIARTASVCPGEEPAGTARRPMSQTPKLAVAPSRDRPPAIGTDHHGVHSPGVGVEHVDRARRSPRPTPAPSRPWRPSRLDPPAGDSATARTQPPCPRACARTGRCRARRDARWCRPRPSRRGAAGGYESDRAHLSLVAHEIAHRLRPCVSVPEAHQAVAAQHLPRGAQRLLAVGGQHDGVDLSRVLPQGVERLASGQLARAAPCLSRLPVRPSLPSGLKRDRAHASRVPAESGAEPRSLEAHDHP